MAVNSLLQFIESVALILTKKISFITSYFSCPLLLFLIVYICSYLIFLSKNKKIDDDDT